MDLKQWKQMDEGEKRMLLAMLAYREDTGRNEFAHSDLEFYWYRDFNISTKDLVKRYYKIDLE